MESSQFTTSTCGRVIRTRTQYDAFVPAPLPPTFDWNGAVRETIEQAGDSLSRFTRNVEDDPDFLELLLRVDACHAAQAEGVACTLTGLFQAGASGAPADAGTRLAQNYIAAFKHTRERLHELPLSLRLVRETHCVLADGVVEPRLTPGYFRTSQNWLGPAGCSLAEATFVPPPPDEMRELLRNWEQYIHTVDETPVLARIAIAHYQLLTLHPFLALNVALSTLVINVVLWQTGLAGTPVPLTGAFVGRSAPQFLERMLDLSRTGAWEKWLLYYATGLMRAAVALGEARRRFNSVVIADNETLNRQQVDGAARRIAMLLRGQPAQSVARLAAGADLRPTATLDAVDRLAALGLVERHPATGVVMAPRIISAVEPPAMSPLDYGLFF